MSSIVQTNDNDSLHTLPLSKMPLEVSALKQTRLVKNTRLEGVVELYRDDSMGSGQVTPDGLDAVFDFSGDRAQDLVIVRKLAALDSYDVYSLRVSLRKLNLEVDNVESLKLSDNMAESLLEHMSVFTRPLILKIYGDKDVQTDSFRDVLRLFTDPDANSARENLFDLAKLLNIELTQIPKFLENYADVYLSLSFYQKCQEDIAPNLEAFASDLQEMARNPCMNSNGSARAVLDIAEEKFRGLHGEVTNILEMFRVRTEDMWKNISAQQYQEMTRLVGAHQEKIGAILCAISVKLDAWNQLGVSDTTKSVTDKANFVNNSMIYGLDDLTSIGFQDV